MGSSKSIPAPISPLDPLTIVQGKTKSLNTQLRDGSATDIFDAPDLFQGSDIHDECVGEDNDDDAEDSGDMNAAFGRISDTSLERIKEGLHEVQKLARDIASETGLSPSQVFHQWMSTSQRTHTKRNP